MKLEQLQDLADGVRGCEGGEITIPAADADALKLERTKEGVNGGCSVSAPAFVAAVDNAAKQEQVEKDTETKKANGKNGKNGNK